MYLLNIIYLSNSSSSTLLDVGAPSICTLASLLGSLSDGGLEELHSSPIDVLGCALFRMGFIWNYLMAEPNRERYTDPTRGLLSKVFIVYPHNPQVYQWIPPTPLEELQRRYRGFSPDELQKIQIDEVKRRKLEEKARIENHDKLVHNFAQFLESHMIAVAYEGLLHDYPTDNYMKWFQKQMKDSDYVMLIITDSFCHFLSNEPPQDKERIFVGNFLHNFVHSPSKTVLPVFLNCPEDSSLLPDALRASATYHVVASEESPFFNVQQPQLDRLYAVLTKQNRMTPPAPIGVVPVISGIQRRGEV